MTEIEHTEYKPQRYRREQLVAMYERSTGLKLIPEDVSRIDTLQAFCNDHPDKIIIVYNRPRKMRYDYKNRIRWYAGMRHRNGHDTVLLGITHVGRRITNAVFAEAI